MGGQRGAVGWLPTRPQLSCVCVCVCVGGVGGWVGGVWGGTPYVHTYIYCIHTVEG